MLSQEAMNNKLHKAIKANKPVSEIQQLISNGAQVDVIKDMIELGRTVINGDWNNFVRIFNFLLSLKDEDGNPLSDISDDYIWKAARHGLYDFVVSLTEVRDKYGQKALNPAVSCNYAIRLASLADHMNIVYFLESLRNAQGQRICNPADFYMEVLFDACKKGDLPRVQYYLSLEENDKFLFKLEADDILLCIKNICLGAKYLREESYKNVESDFVADFMTSINFKSMKKDHYFRIFRYFMEEYIPDGKKTIVNKLRTELEGYGDFMILRTKLASVYNNQRIGIGYAKLRLQQAACSKYLQYSNIAYNILSFLTISNKKEIGEMNLQSTKFCDVVNNTKKKIFTPRLLSTKVRSGGALKMV